MLVEYTKAPLAIGARKPRFSWEVPLEGRGRWQSAYRLLVATSRLLLVPGKADLINRLTLWNAVRAEVYVAPSLYDGEPAVILDYNKTSFFFTLIWDEIRLVGPELWLGRSYIRTWYGDYLMVNFVLDFSKKEA